MTGPAGADVTSPQHQDAMQSALTELGGLLIATATFDELMQAVADLAGRAVPGAATCGITLAEDGHVITVASADPLARLLDERQYELDDGPCLEALRTGKIVLGDDLTRESRWDGYPTTALLHGVRSVLSVPLQVREDTIGAVNFYGTTAGVFDEPSRSAAAQLTALAAATITAVQRHFDQATLTDNLRSALSSRSVIDQAIGIVIGRERCTPEVAFALLRSVSQTRNTPLRRVAEELVARTSRREGESFSGQ